MAKTGLMHGSETDTCHLRHLICPVVGCGTRLPTVYDLIDHAEQVHVPEFNRRLGTRKATVQHSVEQK
jgi:hypothetical protein